MALGLIGVDALAIDVGADLGGLLIAPLAEAMLDRVGEVRRALAGDIGIVIPGVRLRDDLVREPSTYAIRVRDSVVGEGSLRLEGFLAVADEAVLATLCGEGTREPVYGMPAIWIGVAERERAVRAGALVFDPVSIVGSHLAEAARSHAAALLGRQELQTLLEHLRASVPTLVKEIGGDALPLASVHKTFEFLLRERVWPRDAVATLEALVDASATSREPRELAESVRRALVPAQLRRREGRVFEPLVVAPAFEAELCDSWLADGSLAPRPEAARHVRDTIAAYAGRVRRDRAAVVCTSALRFALAEFAARFNLGVEVYAYGEIPAEFELRPAAVLEAPAHPAAALS
jgi:flagellar biosynthesis protein FlhA